MDQGQGVPTSPTMYQETLEHRTILVQMTTVLELRNLHPRKCQWGSTVMVREVTCKLEDEIIQRLVKLTTFLRF